MQYGPPVGDERAGAGAGYSALSVPLGRTMVTALFCTVISAPFEISMVRYRSEIFEIRPRTPPAVP